MTGVAKRSSTVCTIYQHAILFRCYLLRLHFYHCPNPSSSTSCRPEVLSCLFDSTLRILYITFHEFRSDLSDIFLPAQDLTRRTPPFNAIFVYTPVSPAEAHQLCFASDPVPSIGDLVQATLPRMQMPPPPPPPPRTRARARAPCFWPYGPAQLLQIA